MVGRTGVVVRVAGRPDPSYRSGSVTPVPAGHAIPELPFTLTGELLRGIGYVG